MNTIGEFPKSGRLTGALIEHHQFRLDESIARAAAHPAQIHTAFEVYLHGPMRLFGREFSGVGLTVRDCRNY
ncbi:hypothetical protein [Nocardia asteroides]|uniref:hypothetical protein n=1 Tax=Nocardia asteroides TaxID=1824 RepID=UPI001E570DEF|nr:hypothetical protein [Nocardia asteroides]UGT53412.1 hypothetical protein LTT85_22345 [Nocardia asteroides]